MNIPCAKAIRCKGITSQGFDYPVANFSSERPDEPIFVAINYGTADINEPPLGIVFNTPGCIAWCTSSLSQDEADLCAARQQILCLQDIGGDTGCNPDGTSNPETGPVVTPQAGEIPGTKPKLYGNSPQTCTQTCPSGKEFSETVEAGEVIAQSQAQADSIAHSTACTRVAKRIICSSELNGFACADPFSLNPEYSFQFTGTTQFPPLTWSMATGSLPPGLTLEPDGRLHGIPSVAGNYNFSVRSTNSAGSFADLACTFEVLGLNLSSPILPSPKVDTLFNYQLPVSGGAINVFVSSGSLPTGLTLNDNGLITGVATVLQGSAFTVTVQDAFFNECDYDLFMTVDGPKITCPSADGLVCHAYSSAASAVPSGCTFSGSFPKGLSINASTGLVTGTPLETGNFTIIATDPQFHTNTKTCPGAAGAKKITLAPGERASAVHDLIWTENHFWDPTGPNCTSSFSGTGGSLQVLAHGDCVLGSVKDADQNMLTNLRNCGANAYGLIVRVDYTLPGGACGSNHAGIDIIATVNGVNVINQLNVQSLTNVQISGSFSGAPANIAAFSAGNTIQVSCNCRGNVQATFNITLTPSTPP